MTATASLDRLQAAVGARYHLIRELGRGGMAVVYLATDLKQNRTVALKVLQPEVAAALGADRFLREIQIASTLQHPHILGLYDSGESDGILYYTMPFAEGESLRGRLERERQLPVVDAIRIARQVADALSYSHRRGVIHRDIKPGNILLIESQAVVADFGVARALSEAGGEELTKSGVAIGTPAYMSPEQISGDPHVDHRSDIYALGCVVYEMLAGEPPFSGRTPQAVLARHLHEPPPPLRVVRPHLTPAVAEVIERALDKVPADRFQQADEFGAALEAASTALPPLTTSRKPQRRVWGLVMLLMVGLLGTWLALRPVEPTLDPMRVMVFPLRDNAFDGSGEGVATYVGYALEGAAPLRWLEAWDWLGEPQRSGAAGLTAPAAGAISRSQRARYYIDGQIVRTQDSTTVVLRLHDALGDSVVRQAGASAARDAAAIPQLGLRAVADLLPALLEPGRRVDLTPLAQRRPAAIAEFLQGEHDYRRLNFASALGHYQHAVKEDSLLAIAALKGAQAANWRESNDEAHRLITIALAAERGLPQRYIPFARGLQFYLLGDGDSALAHLRGLVVESPDWAEAWTALGETYYHLLPRVALPDSLAEAAFAAARRSDSSFTPPTLHLAEIALRQSDIPRAVALIQDFQRAEPDSSVSRRLDLMLACVRNGPAAVNWEGAMRRDPGMVLLAARLLSTGGAQPACARTGFESVLASAGAETNQRWGALLGLQGLLAAQGRLADLRRLLDSPESQALGGSVLYLLIASAGDGLDAQADEVARSFGTDFRTLSAPVLWALGSWYAHQGDTLGLGKISVALQAKVDSSHSRRDSLLARVMGAHLVLAKGDSAEAVLRLSRLRPNAPFADLEWQPWEALAGERITLARLLLARRDYRHAEELASELDAPQPIVHLTWLPAMLALRIRAEVALHESDRAERLRRRWMALRTDPLPSP